MKNFSWIKVEARTPRGANRMPDISAATVVFSAIMILSGALVYYFSRPW